MCKDYFFSLCFKNAERTSFEIKYLCIAFVAQWIEHWSSKPGVESSILSKGNFCQKYICKKDKVLFFPK